MDIVHDFIERALRAISELSFAGLVAAALGAFGGCMALFAALCARSRRVRAMDKRPLMHFVNAFTALFLAVMLTGADTAQALFWTAVFWLAGYLMYGALCALTRPRPAVIPWQAKPSYAPPRPAKRAADLPAAESGVKLEHALSISDKLLLKELSRADREELERIKRALASLQAGGAMSPAEGEAVNADFASLIKLMARYGY